MYFVFTNYLWNLLQNTEPLTNGPGKSRSGAQEVLGCLILGPTRFLEATPMSRESRELAVSAIVT